MSPSGNNSCCNYHILHKGLSYVRTALFQLPLPRAPPSPNPSPSPPHSCIGVLLGANTGFGATAKNRFPVLGSSCLQKGIMCLCGASRPMAQARGSLDKRMCLLLQKLGPKNDTRELSSTSSSERIIQLL